MLGNQIIGILMLTSWILEATTSVVDPDTVLQCHRREYTYRASQTDNNGLQCWDLVTAVSCWGRCDSGEIGDWRFPFKRPFHPVCVHDEKVIRYTILANCDPGVDEKVAEYEFYDAVSCACLLCDSSTTSCQEVQSYEHHQQHIFTGPLNKKKTILSD